MEKHYHSLAVERQWVLVEREEAIVRGETEPSSDNEFT